MYIRCVGNDEHQECWAAVEIGRTKYRRAAVEIGRTKYRRSSVRIRRIKCLRIYDDLEVI